MNDFKISENIFLNHQIDKVWNIVSSKGALELFHPFCLKNKAINWGDSKKSDELVYLNGLTYIREFISWNPNKGYELIIGKKNGKKSKVHWEIQSSDLGCFLTITVWPYKTSKVPKILYPLVNSFVVKPKLKKYLHSVLVGLKFYLDNNIRVKNNQFGTHAWFS